MTKNTKVAYEAPAREHLHAEEVGRCDRAPMSPQERAPRKRLAPARAIVSSCFVTSLAVGGLPGDRRVSEPSYFAAIIPRYQRTIVSGVASVASSASLIRPH